MQKNTIQFTLPATQQQVTFTVRGKNRPFSNNFVQYGVKRFLRVGDKDAVAVLVQCTDDSKEPERVYFCVYTFDGKLVECAC